MCCLTYVTIFFFLVSSTEYELKKPGNMIGVPHLPGVIYFQPSFFRYLTAPLCMMAYSTIRVDLSDPHQTVDDYLEPLDDLCKCMLPDSADVIISIHTLQTPASTGVLERILGTMIIWALISSLSYT